jgi:EAL domain-containing protein (putative c-di-GMP-specific phosphodiesterase class I)
MSDWESGGGRGGRVLLVDDEEMIRRAFARVITSDGHEVVMASNGAEAVQWLAKSADLDLIVSDIHMPEMSGLELLCKVREHDLDLPVVLMTGRPDVESAVAAVDYGAYRYIKKPVDYDLMREVVRKAVALRRMTRLKREALSALGQDSLQAADRAALEANFKKALGSMWMAYQPIVDRQGGVFGYEALLRSTEPSLPHPGAVIEAAERLGRLEDLGRRVRSVAPDPVLTTADAALFVNLHPEDLSDDELYEPTSPLARIASRVILEITERATLDEVSDVRDRLVRLRKMGFRLAVDDLGAGYAGLSSFATLEPEVIKFDMTLVRGVDSNPVKRKVIEKMTTLAHELKVLVVAEGVETAAERVTIHAIGCDLMQGYLFAKPGKAFPSVTWGR